MKHLRLFAITLLLAFCQASTVTGQNLNEPGSARAALFDAIEAGDQKAVLKILSRRRHVNLNQRGKEDGETFLIEAIRAEQPKIVRILLTHGADPNLREMTVDDQDKQIPGNTPLAEALELDSTEMVGLLIKHGVKLRDNSSALHASTSPEMVRFLLDHGAVVDGRNEEGATYLQTVLNDGDPDEVAELLMERGANVNVVDEEGATPLLRVESVEIAQLLIAHGAKVNVANKEGLTPLHLAISETGNLELAELLLNHGADVNARNREGFTPLDVLVADAFDYEFALLLVRHGAWVNQYLVKEHGLVEEFEAIRKAIAGGMATRSEPGAVATGLRVSLKTALAYTVSAGSDRVIA